MGYRSEVKSIIYGSEQEMKDFKESASDLYKQVREENDEEVRTFQIADRHFIYLSADYTKWYDEYDEVQHWNDLLQLAKEAGLCTEFVRVGESGNGDIEQDYSGANNMNYLTPKCTIDVGFSYYSDLKEGD